MVNNKVIIFFENVNLTDITDKFQNLYIKEIPSIKSKIVTSVKGQREIYEVVDIIFCDNAEFVILRKLTKNDVNYWESLGKKYHIEKLL